MASSSSAPGPVAAPSNPPNPLNLVSIGHPLRLLSLDGGGIRGLSSLLILKELMKRVAPDKKPCEYFHLIGGTSTGGIIAIMLGRLEMDVQTCIDKYEDLGSAIFQPKRSKYRVITKLIDKLKLTGTFPADVLENKIKSVVESETRNSDEPMMSGESPCKVFVCSATKIGGRAILIRSYDNPKAVTLQSMSTCKIWEVARATSAAPTFFDSIKIGRQEFVDGGLGANNPVEFVLREAEEIWTNATRRIQCIVSIGTGLSRDVDIGNNLAQLAQKLKDMAVETETTEMRFRKNVKDRGMGDRYFRFNVQKGLEDVGLDEHNEIGRIENVTVYKYLSEDRNVQSDIAGLIAARPPNEILPLREGSDEYKSHMEQKPEPFPREQSPSDRQSTYKKRATAATGEWFFRSSFQDWINHHKPESFYWLTGEPNSGKTTLVSLIVNKIKREIPKTQKPGCQNRNLKALAYYYISFEDDTKHLPFKMLYSILIQLVHSLRYEDERLPRHYHLPIAFRNFYRSHYVSLTEDAEVGQVTKTIQEVLQSCDRAYLIVDGIDECPPEVQEEILDALIAILSTTYSTTSLLISSRPHKNIEGFLKDTLQGEEKKHISYRQIPIEKSHADQDIRNYARHRMDTHTELKKLHPKMKQRAIRFFVEEANGNFRWVGCLISQLEKAKLYMIHTDDTNPDLTELEKLLKALPEDLPKAYDRVLSEIPANWTDTAVAILYWLALAKRPITLKEAVEASMIRLSNDSARTEEGKIEIRSRLDYKYLPVMLDGLVTSYPLGNGPEATDLVSLAHFSVEEYLKSDKVRDIFRITEPRFHWLMVESCLAYVALYEPDGRDEFGCAKSKYPLLLYACRFWPDHATKFIDTSELSKKASEMGRLRSLLETYPSPTLQLSLRVARAHNRLPTDLLNWFKDQEKEEPSLPKSFDFEGPYSLYLACAYGEPYLAALLLDTGANVNAKYETSETTLHAAAGRGHEEVVSLLLKHGVGVNASFGEGLTALHLAVWHGHEGVVQLLLDTNEADVNAGLSNGETALHWAAWHGYRNILEMLLKYDADPTLQTENGQDPFEWAVRGGHEDLAHLFPRRTTPIFLDDTKNDSTAKLSDVRWNTSLRLLKQVATVFLTSWHSCRGSIRATLNAHDFDQLSLLALDLMNCVESLVTIGPSSSFPVDKVLDNLETLCSASPSTKYSPPCPTIVVSLQFPNLYAVATKQRRSKDILKFASKRTSVQNITRSLKVYQSYILPDFEVMLARVEEHPCPIEVTQGLHNALRRGIQSCKCDRPHEGFLLLQDNDGTNNGIFEFDFLFSARSSPQQNSGRTKWSAMRVRVPMFRITSFEDTLASGLPELWDVVGADVSSLLLSPDNTSNWRIWFEPDDRTSRLLEDTEPIEHHIIGPQISLGNLLDSRKLSDRQKILISYTLAHSMWKLYGSQWLESIWTPWSIYLMNAKTTGQSLKVIESTFNDLVHLGMRLTLSNEPELAKNLDDSETSISSRFPHGDPTLIALGILLVQVAANETLPESLGDDPFMRPPDRVEFLWARKVLYCLEVELPPLHLRALKACLSPDLPRSQLTTDGKRSYLYENVVLPLRNLVK